MNDTDAAGVASLKQAAWFSPLVVEGARPRFISRRDPINPDDSGWQFIDGSESDEWLNSSGHIRMQHLAHATEQWPDLTTIISDERRNSAWEWDESSQSYRDVSAEVFGID